jgi:hypothetical protein
LSVFLYPKSKCPLDGLKTSIKIINQERRAGGQSAIINETKLNVLFGTINKSSHSNVETVLEREYFTSKELKQMCSCTIAIAKEFAPHQI